MSQTDLAPLKRLSCAETAKLVRKALKLAFPGQKFSVRSSNYAGGASIDVSWLDGPTTAAVRAVTQTYAGADFDGMIDLKTHRDSTLMANEDGSVELLRFGADYVLDQRSYSTETVKRVQAEIERMTGEPYEPNRRYGLAAMRAMDLPDELTTFVGGGTGGRICEAFAGEYMFAIDSHGGEWGSTLVYQYLQDKTLPAPAKGAQRSW